MGTHAASRIRPLFADPGPECERDDPWTGPKGFMYGGMSLPTKAELAAEYFRAATLLVQTIRNGECEDYKIANPVMYLYRHGLELLLKGGLGAGDQEGHDLKRLCDKLIDHATSHLGRDVPDWIVERLRELGDIDPNSTAFRYAENRDRSLKRYVEVDGEIYVDLARLQQAMEELFDALSRLLGEQIDEQSEERSSL